MPKSETDTSQLGGTRKGASNSNVTEWGRRASSLERFLPKAATSLTAKPGRAEIFATSHPRKDKKETHPLLLYSSCRPPGLPSVLRHAHEHHVATGGTPSAAPIYMLPERSRQGPSSSTDRSTALYISATLPGGNFLLPTAMSGPPAFESWRCKFSRTPTALVRCRWQDSSRRANMGSVYG